MNKRIGFPLICYEGETGGSPGAASSAPASTPAASTPASTASPGSSPSTAPSSSPAGTSGSSQATPPAPPATSADPPSAGDDFFGLDFADDSGEEDDTSTTPTPPKPAEAAPAEAAPKAPEGQPTSPPQTAQPTPQQPQQPSPGPQEATPQLPTPAEPGRIASMMEQNAPQLIEALTAEYSLSKEDIEALETDAPAYIPKLAGTLHHRIMVNTLKQMERIVPAIIQRFNDAQNRQKEAEDAFFGKWPDLDPVKHRSVVRQYATRYRQMNPQATRDQMFEELGPMVMIAAKVTPGQRQAAQPGAPAAAAPARPNGRPPSPFKPATGGPSAAPQTPPQEDPWGFMGAPGNDDE